MKSVRILNHGGSASQETFSAHFEKHDNEPEATGLETESVVGRLPHSWSASTCNSDAPQKETSDGKQTLS